MKAIAVMVTLLAAGALVVQGADETRCIPCMQGAYSDDWQEVCAPGKDAPALDAEAQFQEALDWQCIIVEIIIGDCIEWDSRPCDACYYPCIGECGIVCAAAIAAGCAEAFASTGVVPVWCRYLNISCIYGCDYVCNVGCPQCQYCVKHEITIVQSCGWVFTE
jgi:hypothetical protein